MELSAFGDFVCLGLYFAAVLDFGFTYKFCLFRVGFVDFVV